MDLLPSTPHEAFSLMLLERLERMEDQVRQLPMSIPYEWLKFVFHAPIVNGSEAHAFYHNYRETCINALFSTRQQTHPRFATWSWRISTGTPEQYRLTVYIRLGTCTPMRHFQTLPAIVQMSHWAPPESHLDIYPTTMAEVKQCLKDKLKYVSSFPWPCSHEGMDVWRYGGDEFEASLETQWNTDPFLQSNNYRTSDEEQSAFREWVLRMVWNKEWSQLFGEDD